MAPYLWYYHHNSNYAVIFKGKNMGQVTQEYNIFLAMGNIFHDTRQYCDGLFKAYGLSRNEWLTLAILRNHPQGVSQKFVKSYLGMEPSYFSKMLNSLEEKDFILRETDKNDRRNRIITLNPASKDKTKKIFAIIHDLNKTIQRDLRQTQLDELYASLEQITNRLNTVINKK